MECEYRPVERAGLYIMVLIILLHTCSLDTNIIENKMEETNQRLDRIEMLLK